MMEMPWFELKAYAGLKKIKLTILVVPEYFRAICVDSGAIFTSVIRRYPTPSPAQADVEAFNDAAAMAKINVTKLSSKGA